MPAMQEPLAFESAPGRVVLRGALTFATVEGAARDSERLLSAGQQGHLDVDLQGVTAADSAGLALLVSWLADARRAQVSLTFSGVPERLLAIARISEVEGLLAPQAATA